MTNSAGRVTKERQVHCAMVSLLGVLYTAAQKARKPPHYITRSFYSVYAIQTENEEPACPVH